MITKSKENESMLTHDKDITADDVRKFFAWEPVPQEDTYEWDGEIRKTGQTKWIRSDTGMWLGTRGESRPHGYSEWLVDNMELLTDSELKIVNFGELDGGRKAYVQIVTEQTQEVAGLDYRPMITATSSMDGSFATGYGRNLQVIVCLNTYQMARDESANDGFNYRVKATKNSRFEVLAARDALKIMFEDADDFAAELDVMMSEKVSETRFEAFARKWSPDTDKSGNYLKGRAQTLADNKRDALYDLWTDDERVAPWRGTKFGVIQAVNTYEHHIGHVRNMAREDRNMLRTMKGQWQDVNAKTARLLASV